MEIAMSLVYAAILVLVFLVVLLSVSNLKWMQNQMKWQEHQDKAILGHFDQLHELTSISQSNSKCIIELLDKVEALQKLNREKA